jgi:hypothetical protein
VLSSAYIFTNKKSDPFVTIFNRLIHLLILCVTLSACDSENSINQYTAKPDSMSLRTTTGAGFIWQAPSHWQYRTPQNPMQLALFLAPENSDKYTENAHTTATVSLSFLKGSAGTLNSNIKRWQKKIGINETSDYADTARLIKTKLGNIQFIKLQNTSTNEALLTAVFEQLDGSLFIKIRGPILTVEQQTDSFVKFVEGVKK